MTDPQHPRGASTVRKAVTVVLAAGALAVGGAATATADTGSPQASQVLLNVTPDGDASAPLGDNNGCTINNNGCSG
ncbi:hypothetical protein [Actinokineospora diospyrosa]|uniref:Chaplin domain-containing protein n=1 Tax=Actinokineospora diospyrosa TaxID=103728 RepID=A0ABT1IBQ2_9PSEU|nr:hypothetical protein [Actinokineospora diospyrosa]MCP2269791.1 hypothetical protein [Actinokineospora diospyrosa]